MQPPDPNQQPVSATANQAEAAPAAATPPPVTPAPNAAEAPPATPLPEKVVLSWNAPEFIYTQKPMGWYALLALFFIALIVIAVFTKQWLSIAVFAVMGVAVAVYASRHPRMLNYALTDRGLHVGDKKYLFDQFSAFFEADDYGQLVFDLIPTRRFVPLVSLPAPTEFQDQIEQNLSNVLPKSPPRTGIAERVSKALRF